MSDSPEALPVAWMGYKADPKKFCVVRICAYCPDKAQADNLAAEAGLSVTHGCCPACYAKQMQALRLENT